MERQDNEVKESWNLEREIRAEHVTYHYPDVEEAVIRDADFTIKKGQTVAFIGASGAGKTTMVDIILGLLEPQQGRIMADGLNVHKKPKTFHAQVGYIPQVIYLSDDTIRNNIAFGVRESEIDEAAVQRAMEKDRIYRQPSARTGNPCRRQRRQTLGRAAAAHRHRQSTVP